MTIELQIQDINVAYQEPPAENLYLLPKTGFSVPLQMEMLRRQKNPEDINLWLEKTREDIKAFWLEYLARLQILPIPIEVENGKLIAPEYGHIPLTETISNSERNGTVITSISKIEKFLVKAKPNSVAILTSPPGWSGLVDDQGQPISYPDTQTYIFYKNAKGKVSGFTLISKMGLVDNEDLLDSLAGNKANLNSSTSDRITSITASPLFFESDGKYSFNPEGVIRAIHALHPDSFDLSRALYLLDNLDDLSHVTSHEYVENLITNFETAVREIPPGANLPEVAASLLGLTILEISGVTRTDTTPIYYNHLNYHSPQRDYQDELQYLQAQGGCNGGGNKLNSKLIESALGVRRTESGTSGPTIYCATCKSEVKTYIKEGIIYCALCGQPLGKAAKEEKEKSSPNP